MGPMRRALARDRRVTANLAIKAVYPAANARTLTRAFRLSG